MSSRCTTTCKAFLSFQAVEESLPHLHVIRYGLFCALALFVTVCSWGANSRSEIDSLLEKRASGQEMTQQEYERLTDGVSDFSDRQLVSVLHTGKDDRLREMCRTE